MFLRLSAAIAALSLMSGAAMAQGAKPTDPQIAHIAYTAGVIDIAAAKQALAKSQNAAVREFASEMARDHAAVNDKALALVKELNVAPADNATSQALSKAAAEKMKALAALQGAEFDKAYVANEVAFHQTVNGALESTLIPSAQNPQLKALLETGATLFGERQKHAEHLATELK